MYGLDSSGLGRGQVTGCCGSVGKLGASIIRWKFLILPDEGRDFDFA
jgi:hypothetical protein